MYLINYFVIYLTMYTEKHMNVGNMNVHTISNADSVYPPRLVGVLKVSQCSIGTLQKADTFTLLPLHNLRLHLYVEVRSGRSKPMER